MKKIINIIKNPKFKMISILTFLLFVYTTICAISYAQSVSQDLSNSVFRLHVIANSDSEEDQNLKYKVRDKLIEYMNSLIPECENKNEVIAKAQEHLADFKKIALNTIVSEGYDYNVDVEIGNFEFPTKQYGDISFPAGFYDALKVKIGKAEGKNWWCVMFPPLCFVDISTGIVPDESKKEMQNNMSEEEFALISDNKSADIQFKFKLLELFGSNSFLTAKK
ncbi:MAG: stage II sporulation protein R [Clostridia bacterium]|nr:stage II sporulation protein R [Clostridia bacterium]